MTFWEWLERRRERSLQERMWKRWPYRLAVSMVPEGKTDPVDCYVVGVFERNGHVMLELERKLSSGDTLTGASFYTVDASMVRRQHG